METVIRAKLIADAAVNALVSGRVRPAFAAAGTDIPYIVYQRITSAPINTLGGTTHSTQTTLQIDIVAATYSAARALAAAVTAVLSGLRDQTTDPRIDMAHLISEIDDVDGPDAGESKPTYRVTQDYQIDHHPA